MNPSLQDKTKPTSSRFSLKRVRDHLFREQTSGRYYLLAKRNGKIFRQSLKTTDFQVAKGRIERVLDGIPLLRPGTGTMTFEELTTEFCEIEIPSMKGKPSTKAFWGYCVQGILKSSSGILRTCSGDGTRPKKIKDITTDDCKRWYAQRSQKVGLSHLNHEVAVLKLIFKRAVKQMYLAANPASELSFTKPAKGKPDIPTPAQFRRLIEQMRKDKNHDAADLCELLAYTGMRLREATALTWGDIDIRNGLFRVRVTKNNQERTPPLFPAVTRFLDYLKQQRGGAVRPDETIIRIQGCRDTMANTCEKLGLPVFTHHHLRHFFCSNAIEHSIDFKVIAEWVGHSDGGLLVAQTYGHVRSSHSNEMAKRMAFDVTS